MPGQLYNLDASKYGNKDDLRVRGRGGAPVICRTRLCTEAPINNHSETLMMLPHMFILRPSGPGVNSQAGRHRVNCRHCHQPQARTRKLVCAFLCVFRICVCVCVCVVRVSTRVNVCACVLKPSPYAIFMANRRGVEALPCQGLTLIVALCRHALCLERLPATARPTLRCADEQRDGVWNKYRDDVDHKARGAQ
jgi:hypothetical protein